MSLKADGAAREFRYDQPKSGLPVQAGTLLFAGTKNGLRYTGTAYAFTSACGAIPFSVTGDVSPDERTITLIGPEPRAVDTNCKVVQTTNSILVFRLRGDVAQAPGRNQRYGSENIYMSCDEKKRNGYVLEPDEVDYCGGLPRKEKKDEESKRTAVSPDSKSVAKNDQREHQIPEQQPSPLIPDDDNNDIDNDPVASDTAQSCPSVFPGARVDPVANYDQRQPADTCSVRNISPDRCRTIRGYRHYKPDFGSGFTECFFGL